MNARGFSLVEVAIAVAVASVASVAMVGILSLLPVGLKVGRDTESETRATQMALDIIQSLRAQPYDTANLFGRPCDLGNPTAPIHLFADTDGNISPDRPTLGAYDITVAFSPVAAIPRTDACTVTVDVRWFPTNAYPARFATIIPNTGQKGRRP